MNLKQFKFYIWLFKTNFFISAFTFGGGYVVIPMIRKYFVLQKNLFDEEELLNMAAIAQSSPGAIAINLAVLAGYKTAGLTGAIISAVSAVVPPFIILSLISSCYKAFSSNLYVSSALKGMEAGVGALMVDIVWDMGQAILLEKRPFFSIMMPLTFLLCFGLQIPVIYLILGSAVMCVLYVKIMSRKGVSI